MPFVASASNVQMPERHPKAARLQKSREGDTVLQRAVLGPMFG